MVPVMAQTDVLVVGSGPGGLAAALAARREGMETMLVDLVFRRVQPETHQAVVGSEDRTVRFMDHN